MPTQLPDTHPEGYPQSVGGRRPPPLVEAAKGRLPYGWVSGSWLGKEEITPWQFKLTPWQFKLPPWQFKIPPWLMTLGPSIREAAFSCLSTKGGGGGPPAAPPFVDNLMGGCLETR